MRRTVEANGLASRVSMRVGDLRDESVLPERGVFELVTGSPPYIPLGKGVVSPVAQRAACRMELRGSIADYAVTAARILKPKGSFVVCFTASDPRGPEAIKAAGLHVRVRQDVVFRGGQAPLIAIFAAQHEPCALDHRSDFSIRGPDGEWTEAYFQLREQMGTVLERKPEVRTPPRARGGAR
jgi:tRNA1(Val) A37 N6-methylase TrmN6